MINTALIAKILNKKINGQLSDDDNKLLYEWAKLSHYNRSILQKIEDKKILYEDVLILLEWNSVEDESVFISKVTDEVLLKINQSSASKILSYKGKGLLIAAFILIVLSIIPVYNYFKVWEEPEVVLKELYVADKPALVKLSSGQVIILDTNQRELILDTELTYKDGSVVARLDQQNIVDITLEIPKGGSYYLKLQDGSEVWLNSDSKLHYPSRFAGKKRGVRLEGEAYFKISKLSNDGKRVPFFVETKGQSIEVLGTEFNVMAYEDENIIESTLVEGSVKVHIGNMEVPLHPGQQIRNVNNHISKANVDVDQYLAWRNNTFNFHETRLEDALRILSRWYDFEIQNKNNQSIPETHIYASISRSKGLSDVLKMMESTGLHFKIVNKGKKNILIIDN